MNKSTDEPFLRPSVHANSGQFFMVYDLTRGIMRDGERVCLSSLGSIGRDNNLKSEEKYIYRGGGCVASRGNSLEICKIEASRS